MDSATQSGREGQSPEPELEIGIYGPDDPLDIEGENAQIAQSTLPSRTLRSKSRILETQEPIEAESSEDEASIKALAAKKKKQLDKLKQKKKLLELDKAIRQLQAEIASNEQCDPGQPGAPPAGADDPDHPEDEEGPHEHTPRSSAEPEPAAAASPSELANTGHGNQTSRSSRRTTANRAQSAHILSLTTTPKWQTELKDREMLKAPQRKIEKIQCRNYKELEQFITNAKTYHAYNHWYFNGPDYRKVLEAAQHFDTKLLMRWSTHMNTLDAAPTWENLVLWLVNLTDDPDKVSREADMQYMKMQQREYQSVYDFATDLQSVELRCREHYTDSQRKTHLYTKVVPEIRVELDKHAVRMEDLDYEGLITKLTQVENNMPDRVKQIKNGARNRNKDANDGKSLDERVSFRNDKHDKSFKRKRETDAASTKPLKTKPSNTWCNFHKSNTHSDAECKAQKAQRDRPSRPNLDAKNA
ncbi:hypothetical protein AJ80_09764 [Polytolypa hystricis UAMH7299]|uniref:Retrotransposon gag domain-containing protein n=1 Tax=Polytolypa hystricis (strain UAMH7299) TaxID=1447883 RepID=A0A2B7WK62_POLH7|nr:hypothetical protein AJ80_09764 [Polytolypa hystricis UAMH7299]